MMADVMAGAEGAGLVERIEQAERRAFGSKGAVDREAFLILQPKHVSGRPLLEECPEFAELCALDGDAGRHAMAAALDDQTGIGGFAHQSAKIEARNGAARTGANTIGIEGNGESRPTRMMKPKAWIG